MPVPLPFAAPSPQAHAFVPSAAPGWAAPPAPALRVAPTPRRSATLLRSLRASTAEGVAAEVVGACCGGAVLTGWALHLGCGPALIGLLGVLPFVAQLVQLPAARLTARFGARRVALVSVALSRQAFLPLVVLPFLPVGPGAARAVLFGAAAAHHTLGIACNNAWVAWMGELVPARVRGRYFGRRTAVCTAAGAVAALAAGALLDRAPGPHALAALALVSCVAGAASAVLMARQHGGHPVPRAAGAHASLVAVLRVPAARRYVAYLVVSGAGAGLIVPFAGLYVLRDRGLGFTFLSGYGAVSALARIASARRWGRLVDRARGARAAVAGSTAMLAASPLLWIAAATAGPWVLAAEAVTGGVATAGAGVAGLAVPLALAPPAARPAYHAVFAISGGLAFAAGAASAGPLAALFPSAAALAGPLTAPFVASAALRAGAAVLALRLHARSGPGASPR